MFNYVNEDAFLSWYRGKAASPLPDAKALEALARGYLKTRVGEFVIPAEESKSGTEERYPFRFENIGCCGASTLYFYL